MPVTRTSLCLTAVLAAGAGLPFSLAAQVELKSATHHPMAYYLSLPTGWTAAKRWPVVVVIEGAERHFKETAQAFVAARGSQPFIIVAPLVLTGGGAAQQHQSDFPYSEAAWARAAADGNCAFDEDGLAAVVADLQQTAAADARFFLTGWEAGGHVVWAQVFRHPERWRAVALVSPNFAARCLDEGVVSRDSARASLSVTVLHDGAAAGWSREPGGWILAQWERAHALALSHGYGQVRETLVPDYHHGPMPHEVLALFARMLAS